MLGTCSLTHILSVFGCVYSTTKVHTHRFNTRHTPSFVAGEHGAGGLPSDGADGGAAGAADAATVQPDGGCGADGDAPNGPVGAAHDGEGRHGGVSVPRSAVCDLGSADACCPWESLAAARLCGLCADDGMCPATGVGSLKCTQTQWACHVQRVLLPLVLRMTSREWHFGVGRCMREVIVHLHTRTFT